MSRTIWKCEVPGFAMSLKKWKLTIVMEISIQCVEMALKNYKNFLHFLHSAMKQEILVVIILLIRYELSIRFSVCSFNKLISSDEASSPSSDCESRLSNVSIELASPRQTSTLPLVWNELFSSRFDSYLESFSEVSFWWLLVFRWLRRHHRPALPFFLTLSSTSPCRSSPRPPSCHWSSSSWPSWELCRHVRRAWGH